MKDWIDIDNPNHLSAYKAIINELRKNGHYVLITAPKSKKLKNLFQEHGLIVSYIGYKISFLDLFTDQLNLMRSASITDFLKDKKIDIVFSLGSKIMFYVCLDQKLSLAIIQNEIQQDKTITGYSKCFSLVPESIPEQKLIESGFNMARVIRYKGMFNKEELNFDLRTINELTGKLEFLSKHMPGSLSA